MVEDMIKRGFIRTVNVKCRVIKFYDPTFYIFPASSPPPPPSSSPYTSNDNRATTPQAEGVETQAPPKK
jgi:hypothetical protein